MISVKPKNPWGAGWLAPLSPPPLGKTKPPAGIPVEEDPNKGTGDTNFCKPDIISQCSAGKIWREHTKCKFAYKASRFDRCTDYFEGFCKCLDAQIDSRDKTKTLTDCIGL